jgi:hypothetical protein
MPPDALMARLAAADLAIDATPDQDAAEALLQEVLSFGPSAGTDDLDAGAISRSGRRVRARLRSGGHFTRWAAVGTVAVAAAVVLLVVGTTGGGPASAFAGWTADPTPATASQLQAGEASCATNPALSSLAPTLTDTRGPFSMFVYLQANMTTICIARLANLAGGGGASGPAVAPPVIAQYGAPGTSSIAPDTIRPEDGIGIKPKDAMFSGSTTGQGLRILTGQVGPDVTAVTLILNDGSSIEATIENGWFAAWWPNLQGVQSADLTTATGSTTQPLNIPTLPLRASPAGPTQQGASSPSGSATTPTSDATGATGTAN